MTIPSLTISSERIIAGIRKASNELDETYARHSVSVMSMLGLLPAQHSAFCQLNRESKPMKYFIEEFGLEDVIKNKTATTSLMSSLATRLGVNRSTVENIINQSYGHNTGLETSDSSVDVMLPFQNIVYLEDEGLFYTNPDGETAAITEASDKSAIFETFPMGSRDLSMGEICMFLTGNGILDFSTKDSCEKTLEYCKSHLHTDIVFKHLFVTQSSVRTKMKLKPTPRLNTIFKSFVSRSGSRGVEKYMLAMRDLYRRTPKRKRMMIRDGNMSSTS